MSNFNFIDELIVLFNNKEVGKLKIEDGLIYFKYHHNWLKNGFSISPFKLPLKDQVFKWKNNNQEIWGVFLDCLPDGWGIRLNIKKCAQHGINYNNLNILEKLSLTDKTGLGGLDFLPSNNIKENIKINLNQIVNDVIENYQDISNLKLINEIYQQANSTGGARPKLHFRDIDNHNWIVKLPMNIDDLNVGRKEYESNLIAKKSGINTNDFKLIKLEIGIELFAAKRFDILENGEKLHTISIAGLLDLDFRIATIDYINVFEIISMISVNKQEDYYEFFKRMVFNYKYNNCDDHLKNTNFIYDNSLNGYKLSPSFDTTKTPELKYHKLLCNNKEFPNNKDFLEIANKFNLNIKECESIISNIENILKLDN